MKANELINKLISFCSSEGLEIIERAPMINKVTPNTFNFSLEEPLLRKFGSLVNITAPWAFSTIQPCIRMADHSQLRRRIDLRWHLSMFHIGVVDYQINPNPDEIKDLHKRSIERLFNFLVEKVGLNPKRFLVNYFGGGWINEISEGRIRVRKYFKPDETTVKTFKDLGLTSEQIQPKKNLDTFLVTFPFPVDFWAGYRYELFYRINGNLVEIATGEAVRHKRVVRGGKVIDIVDLGGCVVPVVVGIERVLLVKNELNSLFECDHILPLLEFIRKKIKVSGQDEENETKIKLLVDSIRALHIIVADGGRWEKLNPHLKDDLNDFLRTIYDCTNMLKLTNEDLHQLFKLNAVLQPWLGNLDSSCEYALTEYINYCKRRK